MFLFAIGVKPEREWVWFTNPWKNKTYFDKAEIQINFMKVKTCRTATDTCSRKRIMLLLCRLKGSKRNRTKMFILVNRTNHFQHVTKLLQVTSITSFRYLVPATKGEGRNIVLVWIPSALAAWLFIVCTLSLEPIGGVRPNLHRHIIWREERSDRFWWHWPHFQGHTSTLKFSNFDRKVCLHPVSWSKWQILTKIHIYCNGCMD